MIKQQNTDAFFKMHQEECTIEAKKVYLHRLIVSVNVK